MLIDDILEQQGRSTRMQGAFVDLGDFQIGRDLRRDADEIAIALKLVNEVAQGFIGHVRVSLVPAGETATSLQKMPVRDAPQPWVGCAGKLQSDKAFAAGHPAVLPEFVQFLDLFD